MSDVVGVVLVGPLFPLGQLVATPGAMEALERNGNPIAELLARYIQGDWGTVDQEDWHANDAAVVNGDRILAAYNLNDGTKLWAITEADSSSTCLLLPEEY